MTVPSEESKVHGDNPRPSAESRPAAWKTAALGGGLETHGRQAT